jgi:hypothetical protein
MVTTVAVIANPAIVPPEPTATTTSAASMSGTWARNSRPQST